MDKILTIQDLEKYLVKEVDSGSGRTYHIPNEMIPDDKWDEFCIGINRIHQNTDNGDSQVSPVYISVSRIENNIKDYIREMLYMNEKIAEKNKWVYDNPSIKKVMKAISVHNSWDPNKTDVWVWEGITRDKRSIESAKDGIVKLLVGINSWTDVVTNSSSEIFVCESNKTAQHLGDMISKISEEEDEWSFDPHVREYNTKDAIYEAIAGYSGNMDFDIYEYGITDDDIIEINNIFRKVHGFGDDIIYIISISQQAANTIDWIEKEMGAKYWTNA